jgi:hypothetical protein
MLAMSEMTVYAILESVLLGTTFLAIFSISLTVSALRSPLAPRTVMARMTLSYGAGQIVGPAIIIFVISDSGNYVLALLTAAVAMAIGSSCPTTASRP